MLSHKFETIHADKGKGFFLSYVDKRISNNQNFMAVITGRTGSGKSYSALSLAERDDPDFDIGKVCFNTKEFMELIEDKDGRVGKGANIIWDEMQVDMSSLDFQQRQAKIIGNVLQTFRNRNLVVWITTPSLAMINANARRLVHCHLQTVGINRSSNSVYLQPLMLEPSQMEAKIYYKYIRAYKVGKWRPVKLLSVPMPSRDLVKAYERKKRRFTNALNEQISYEISNDGITEYQKAVVETLKQFNLDTGALYLKGTYKNITKSALVKVKLVLERKGWLFKPIIIGDSIVRYEVVSPRSY